jgi:3-phosphoshikimate 1-carboxyvinyltransferase
MNTTRITLTPTTPVANLAVRLPGSKSYTIRALLLAVMTPGSVILEDPLLSDDTRAMLACLNTLGLQATWTDERTIQVDGHIADIAPDGETLLDCDLSAASLRFLLALAALLPGVQILQGKNGLNKRPVRDLVDSLRDLGAEIDYLDREGYPPVKVRSSTLSGESVRVKGDTSSQYLSALMMIAPAMGGLTLIVEGELLSRPYLDMTAAIMEQFGVTPQSNEDGRQFVIPAGQCYQANRYAVEGDASAAAYPLAAATLTGQALSLVNLPPESIQADRQFIRFLEAMGNQLSIQEGKLHYQGIGVKPMTLDMRDCPDQAQTMAVLLSFAPGVSRLEGLKSLRVKETDRLAAVAQELTKMGVRVEEEAEALVIHGGFPKIASIRTYGDHRMAMAFAVAGARLDGLQIEDPGVVAKTYPGFWQDCPQWGIGLCTKDLEEDLTETRIAKINAQPSPTTLNVPEHRSQKLGALASLEKAFTETVFKQSEKIVLIGFMGAGKSQMAQLLAERLGLLALDTDVLALEKTPYTSIGKLFAAEGETRFRELELVVSEALQGQQRAVIATGGGMVMNKLAMDYLAQNATVIYLEASLETLLTRLLHEETSRPLLQDRLGVHALYDLRVPLYRHYAHCHIATDADDPAMVLENILAALAVESRARSENHQRINVSL